MELWFSSEKGKNNIIENITEVGKMYVRHVWLHIYNYPWFILHRTIEET
jgi:hypothetical protein